MKVKSVMCIFILLSKFIIKFSVENKAKKLKLSNGYALIFAVKTAPLPYLSSSLSQAEVKSSARLLS